MMKYGMLVFLIFCTTLTQAMRVIKIPTIEQTQTALAQLHKESFNDAVSKKALEDFFACAADGNYQITDDKSREKLAHMDMLDEKGSRVHIQHCANVVHLRLQ